MNSIYADIVFLRHAQTEYTNEFPDITEEGRESVEKRAREIRDSLDKYEEIIPDTAAEAFHKGWDVNERTTMTNQLWILLKQIEYD